MPSTVSELLEAAGLVYGGAVKWREPVPLDARGVYLVARNAVPDVLVAPSSCAVSESAVQRLLDVRPELTLDGVRPTPASLSQHVARFWLANEPVVYIGLAGSSVRSRVRAYYRTPLGARRPHAGGWFLKLLADLDDLWVHWAVAISPAAAEDRLLAAFCQGVAAEDLAALADPAHPFPFANLEWPRGTRKLHGIKGAREGR